MIEYLLSPTMRWARQIQAAMHAVRMWEEWFILANGREPSEGELADVRDAIFARVPDAPPVDYSA